jgi:hypothetical protein
MFGLLLSLLSLVAAVPQTTTPPITPLPPIGGTYANGTTVPAPPGVCHCFVSPAAVAAVPANVPKCTGTVCNAYPGKSEANCKAITGTWAPAGAVEGKCTDKAGVVVPPL